MGRNSLHGRVYIIFDQNINKLPISQASKSKLPIRIIQPQTKFTEKGFPPNFHQFQFFYIKAQLRVWDDKTKIL